MTILLNLPIALSSLQVAALPVKAGEEMSAEIIAVQIRKQGFPCNKALSAEMDETLSTPHVAAWTLRCNNATYRVRLVPKMAAVAERVDRTN